MPEKYLERYDDYEAMIIKDVLTMLVRERPERFKKYKTPDEMIESLLKSFGGRIEICLLDAVRNIIG